MWARLGLLNLLLGVAALAADKPALPDGPGKKTLESACTACHTLDVVKSKKWSREKWQDVVLKKPVRLNQEETQDVIGYLSRHFSPKDRSQQLVEEICSFCHGLFRLKGQAYTRDEWLSVTKGMIFEGAPVTDEEYTLILDYLEKNYGPTAAELEEKR